MKLLRYAATIAVITTSLAFGQAANDECATATVISAVPFNASQNSKLATVNIADPKFNCNDTAGLGKTVWFTYTATADTGVIFSTNGSTPADYDIMLGLFSGSCGSLKYEDCNDDANGNRQSELYHRVKSGTTYFILIGEWANGGPNGGTPTGGNLVFNAKYGNPPALVKGPKLGTVASGTVVSISSFPAMLPKTEGDPSLMKEIDNREVELKKKSGIIKKFPQQKTSGHQVDPTGPEGSNVREDNAAALSVIARPVIQKGFLGVPQTTSIPPDPIMAVGPQHVIVMVNTSFRIYDKNGALLKTIPASTFYNSIAPSSGPNDPQIVYDHFAKRFIMLWMTDPGIGNDHRHLIAVSKDSSAMGDWYMWNTSAVNLGDSSSVSWGDYPALSFDQNAVYLTSNQFSLPLSSSVYQYVKLRIFNKASLLANTGGAISFADFWDFKDPQSQSTPGNVRPMNGYSSSAKSYMMNTPNTTTANYMTLWTITNPSTTTPSITAINIPVVQYSDPGNANQLGGGSPAIESGSNKIRANIIYRDSLLWAVHSIAYGTGSAVRYVKLNPNTNQVLEDAALGLTGYWHFYPSIMVDANQNMLLTYSRSGSSEYAGAYVSGRRKIDPPGISSSIPMREGAGNYVLTFGGSRNRWGDYSGIALDPSDPSSFWSHVEYATNSNSWSTWVSKSKIGPVAGALASLNKTSLSFGTKQVGLVSDTLEITIINDGLDSLNISSISNTSANYLVLGKPATPSKIGSLGVISLKVVFTPTVTGVMNDSIVITTNDADKPVQTVKLSGTGFKITLSQQGTIYASSGVTDGGKLYTVNSGNGSATSLGAIGVTNIASLRVHPKTKELIGYDPTGSATGGAFYKISSESGSFLKSTSVAIANVKGLTFENDTIAIMGTFSGGIYRVNFNTGTTTQIGLNFGLRPAGLALNPVNGTLWMSLRSTAGGADTIYKINKTNGAATKVGRAGTGSDILDIIFDKNGKLYGISGTGTAVNNLIRIDTTTGAATVVGSMGKSNILAIALNPDAVAGVEDQLTALPTEYSLSQNYPNPFNPMTTIKFTVPSTVKVVLRVYDAIGREVSTLADGYRQQGTYTEYFDGTKLSSGVYYYKLHAGSYTEVKRMLLVK